MAFLRSRLSLRQRSDRSSSLAFRRKASRPPRCSTDFKACALTRRRSLAPECVAYQRDLAKVGTKLPLRLVLGVAPQLARRGSLPVSSQRLVISKLLRQPPKGWPRVRKIRGMCGCSGRGRCNKALSMPEAPCAVKALPAFRARPVAVCLHAALSSIWVLSRNSCSGGSRNVRRRVTYLTRNRGTARIAAAFYLGAIVSFARRHGLREKLARELRLIACAPIPSRGDKRFKKWDPDTIFPPGRWGEFLLEPAYPGHHRSRRRSALHREPARP